MKAEESKFSQEGTKPSSWDQNNILHSQFPLKICVRVKKDTRDYLNDEFQICKSFNGHFRYKIVILWVQSDLGQEKMQWKTLQSC